MNLFTSPQMLTIDPVAVTWLEENGPHCQIFRDEHEAMTWYIVNNLQRNDGALWREDGSNIAPPTMPVEEATT